MCTVTTRYDRASVVEEELWSSCLLAGFDEVLALGGAGRATAGSFTEPTAAAAQKSSSNGSSAS
jgi:hypothetical protein